MAYFDLYFTFQMPREMTISSKRPKKSVNHERNGKSRVEVTIKYFNHGKKSKNSKQLKVRTDILVVLEANNFPVF